MYRFAIFVDAGYFFAAGGQAVQGSSVPRRQISVISSKGLIDALTDRGRALTENPSFLRVYWYDAVQGPRMSMDQTSLAHERGVKLRLGSLNTAGEQKGVDSLIVTDIIELARNKAIVDAVLVSGDEDLRIAVQVAQTFGVRVHLLAVGDATKNVSPSLQMEADSLDTLTKEWLARHLEIKAPAPAPPVRVNAPIIITPSTGTVVVLEEAARVTANELLSERSPKDIEALGAHLEASRTVPPEYDRRLIAKTAKILGGRKLDSSEMRKIRGVFVVETRKRLTGSTPS